MRPETGSWFLFLFTFGLQADGRIGPYIRRRQLPSSYPVLRRHMYRAIERHVRWPIYYHDLGRKWCTSPKNGRRLDVSLNAVVFHRHVSGRSATARKEEIFVLMSCNTDEMNLALHPP